MIELITNNFVQSIAALIGTVCGVIAIIQAARFPKRIKYRVAKKNKQYVVCFWNASYVPIYKEDIHNFYILVNNMASAKVLYSTDIDLPLTLKLSDKADVIDERTKQRSNVLFKTLDLEFEFLPPQSGYMILINNETSLKEKRHKFLINGRIKGERANSISTSLKSYKGSTLMEKDIVYKFCLCFFKGLFWLIYIGAVIVIIYQHGYNQIDMAGWFSFSGLLIYAIENVRNMFVNAMPLKLKGPFKKARKDYGVEVSYQNYDYQYNVRNQYY